MKRRNESRQWIWPFGKRKKTAPSRKLTPKAVERQSKERESERLEKKLSDAQLEAKLRKHYARGGNLREFLQANPGWRNDIAYQLADTEGHILAGFQTQGEAFKEAQSAAASSGKRIEVVWRGHDGDYRSRWFGKRAARGNPLDWTPYGDEQKPMKRGFVKILGQTVRVGSKKHAVLVQTKRHSDDLQRSEGYPRREGAARGNPTKFTVKVGSHYEDANTYAQARERARVLSETMNYIGFIYQGTRMVESIDARPGHKRNPTGKSAAYEAGRKALASAASKLGTVNLTPSIAQREDWSHAWKEFMAGWNAEKRRPNPADAAADVYEEFHGRPSSEVVTVTEKIHYHKNLAALGELRTLIVQARDGERVTLTRFKRAILCTNEAKNQLFVRGGDQSVDLKAFDIRTEHEVETLGKVVELAYFTTKDHLGDEGGTALYFHVAGETNENGKRKMAGWGPDLIYHTLDERLKFSGGSYTIRGEGVDK